MNQHPMCPKCGRNKYRIVNGLCQSCYCTAFNKARRPPRKNPIDVPITDLQREFLTGCLLGDGWITNVKYGRKSPAFGIDRKQDDLKYLEWQYNFVNNLCLRPIVLKDKLNKTTGRTQKHCVFETRFLPSLLEFRKLWYPNEIKVVPQNLKLTKLIMQLWYCDDGSLEIFDSGNFRMKFSTHGFSKDENIYLADLLKDKYCGKFSIHKDNNKWRICANTNIAPVVLEDLRDGFPPGMERKMI